MARMSSTKKIVATTLFCSLMISISVVSTKEAFTYNGKPAFNYNPNSDQIFIQEYRLANTLKGSDTWGSNYEFSFNDNCAYSWIKFSGSMCRMNHIVTWKWYSPEGKLYSVNTINLASDCVGSEWSLSSRLPIKGSIPTSLAGKWKVDVYFDDIFAFMENFKIGSHINESKPMATNRPHVISLGGPDK